MRRLLVLGTLAVTGLLFAPQAASAQTQPFEAHFKGTQTKKANACGNPLAFCGSGSVEGFGAADYLLVPTSLPVPQPNGCDRLTVRATITLRDGTGTVTLDVTGQVCYPGNSGNTPGSLKSFGNPFTATGTFVISGGTGVFVGASGSGTAVLKGAGAHNSAQATGTITL